MMSKLRGQTGSVRVQHSRSALEHVLFNRAHIQRLRSSRRIPVTQRV